MRSILASLVVAVMLTGGAVAGPFADALRALLAEDYATASRLLRPLAAQGHAGAQHNLGVVYGNGQGVPQSYAEALKWYRLAAEQGVAQSQSNLGLMYDNGQGVPQDYAEALKWYRLAAMQGHGPAQQNLGVMYVLGQGVPQDYVQAHIWFNLAAANGANAAGTYRDRIAPKMTPEQIALAQRLAREWKPK